MGVLKNPTAREKPYECRLPPCSAQSSAEPAAAGASGSMVPTALGALLALLPLASTLQSPGKVRDLWAGLGS